MQAPVNLKVRASMSETETNILSINGGFEVYR